MKAQFQVFKKYRFLLKNLISRDLKVKYRRSFLGLAWSILNPFLMMLVISAVFSNIFKFDIPYFPIYYLTGALLYNFVVEATNGSMVSIINAAPLIKKVYIPKYIFPLEKCMFAFVNMLFTLIAVIIMILLMQMPLHWTLVLFPIPMIYALVFSVGFGLILAAGNVFFRDIGHLYSVFTTAWMYLTPIIYPMEVLENMPSCIVVVVKCNPLYHYINFFRQVVMEGTVPTLFTHLICAVTAAAFLAVGLFVFKKAQDRFILYV